MAYADGVTAPVIGPSARMASWSFYLGLIGFIAVLITPALRALAFVIPILLYGGLAFGIIAVVLGIVGLLSFNRASAVAGLIFGALAIAAFVVYVYYLHIVG